MLRSPAKRSLLVLATDGVALALPNGEVHGRELDCPRNSGNPQLIEKAAELLHGAAVRPRVVDCLCADAFARYAVVPWDPTARSRADDEILARIALEPILEETPDAWEIRLSPARFGRSSLACAMRRDYLASLHEGVTRTGAKLGAVTPLLSLVIDRWAVRLRQGDAALLSVSPGCTVALAWLDGQYGWVRAVTGEGGHLPSLLRRTHALYGGQTLPDCHATVFGATARLHVDELCGKGSRIERALDEAGTATAMVRYARG